MMSINVKAGLITFLIISSFILYIALLIFYPVYIGATLGLVAFFSFMVFREVRESLERKEKMRLHNVRALSESLQPKGRCPTGKMRSHSSTENQNDISFSKE